jgi:hypothetical protein
MDVRKLNSYRETLESLELLRSKNTNNPNVKERIRLLEIQLEEESKALPRGQLWEACVQKVKK